MNNKKQQVENEFNRLGKDQKIKALLEALDKATNGIERYYNLYLSHGIKKASN